MDEHILILIWESPELQEIEKKVDFTPIMHVEKFASCKPIGRPRKRKVPPVSDSGEDIDGEIEGAAFGNRNSSLFWSMQQTPTFILET